MLTSTRHFLSQPLLRRKKSLRIIKKSVSPHSTIKFLNSRSGCLKTTAVMYVWNLPGNTGFPCSIYLRIPFMLPLLSASLCQMLRAVPPFPKMPWPVAVAKSLVRLVKSRQQKNSRCYRHIYPYFFCNTF